MSSASPWIWYNQPTKVSNCLHLVQPPCELELTPGSSLIGPAWLHGYPCGWGLTGSPTLDPHGVGSPQEEGVLFLEEGHTGLCMSLQGWRTPSSLCKVWVTSATLASPPDQLPIYFQWETGVMLPKHRSNCDSTAENTPEVSHLLWSECVPQKFKLKS